MNVMQTYAGHSWWRHGIIYQVYPRSFQDSDGDGIGDLKGIMQRLDYLADLGITTIYLPITDGRLWVRHFRL
jgi:alpha-glucosidase